MTSACHATGAGARPWLALPFCVQGFVLHGCRAGAVGPFEGFATAMAILNNGLPFLGNEDNSAKWILARSFKSLSRLEVWRSELPEQECQLIGQL